MDLISGLSIVSSSPKALNALINVLNTQLSLPNFPLQTEGGETFWNNLAECNGWRLQQNMITHHCRIIDENHVRRAWGTKNGMIEALDTIYELRDKYK